MKKTAGLMCSLALLASCSDWDDHFSEFAPHQSSQR